MDASQTEVKRLLQDIDTDGDFTIEFDEFVHLLSGELADSKSTETKEKEAFSFFDRDGTGRITVKNLAAVAKDFKTTMGDAGALCDNKPELQQMLGFERVRANYYDSKLLDLIFANF